jgi:peptidoglycan hydrolase-like protein with peptidoglycan-binding domain
MEYVRRHGKKARVRLKVLVAMAAPALLVPLAVVISPGTALASGCNSNAVGSWSNNCTVVEGDVNNLVVGLQNFIDAFGECGQVATDGSFGPATLAAVKCQQKLLGVTADGSVGPITWGAMQSRLIKGTTSGGWEYWGTEPGARDFGENTSTKAWEPMTPTMVLAT